MSESEENHSNPSSEVEEEAEEEEQSDAEMSIDDENEAEDPSTSPKKKKKVHQNKGKVVHKTLYIQFPCKVPENAKIELEDCHRGVLRARFPRQKKTRFAFVDCDSEKTAAEVEKLLETQLICGFKVFVNRNRRIDNPEYKKKLIMKKLERKLAKAEAKRMKRELKRKQEQEKASKKKKGPKTNKVVVTKIPENATESTIKECFPSSVEFAFREKPSKVAFVTFSTAEEAENCIKRKPVLGDVKLAVRPSIQIAGKWGKKKGKKGKKVV